MTIVNPPDGGHLGNNPAKTESFAPDPRVFAVVPAAGESRRMGQPKLLLPLGDRTVIECLLQTLLGAGLRRIVVVIRPDDVALRLVAASISDRVAIVQPDFPPPDMRSSVEHGLRWLADHELPRDNDAWLLCPADHPLLEPDVVSAALRTWNSSPERIVVPTFEGRRGHPTVFPWSMAPQVMELPENVGLNSLIRSRAEAILEIPVESASALADLDTPEDYQRWQTWFQKK